MNPWDQFSGANAGYVYELFERYQRDPASVDEATRRAFATWTPSDPTATSSIRDLSTVAPQGATVDVAGSIAAFKIGSIRQKANATAESVVYA